MKDTKVAARYAKSLLDLSIEMKNVEAVLADMKLIHSVCAENKELIALLKSPIIKSDKKNSILNDIFGKSINPLTQKFVDLLCSKSRESYLQEIAEQFSNQYKTKKGITTAVFSISSALDDITRAQLLAILQKTAKGEIEISEKIKPDLLGGFVLRIGDTQIDASVLRQIKNLKRNFSENPYVKEF